MFNDSNTNLPQKNGSEPPVCLLVVDDEPDICRLFSEVITAAGFQVETAGDGEAGWEALQKKDYRLVITDQNMPKLNGTDLFKRMRQAGRNMPVILVTGSIPLKDDLINFDATLLKPCLPNKLVRTIKSILSGAGFEDD